MNPSPLDTLLATLTSDGDDITATIDPSWMQGRTAYGGISSAVALAAVIQKYAPEKPLRSAQISFVGPVGGECRVATRALRQSKSSLFVDAGVSSADGFGTAGLFTFSGARASHLDYSKLAMPDVPPPESLEPVPPSQYRPIFTRHFDMRPVGGPRLLTRQDRAEMLTWVRFVETPACHPAVALLALGDALPPAALHLFREFGPISSMNWTVNMLTDTPVSDAGGWWLLSATSPYARGGFSVQDMVIWNRAGEAVATGSQGVAIYC
ncbi:MAG: thioesterase family protein [Sphingopyxis sp.]|nr:thioesterase family protein [Sphingopyxis sp.]